MPHSPSREHPVGGGTVFPFSDPAENFSGNTAKMNRKVLRGKAALSLQTPTPQPMVRSRTVATQLCCAGASFRLCRKLMLPHITTQILPNYNGFSPAAKNLMGCFSSCFSFSAVFPLCMLPIVVLCCPLQSRASFSLLSPSFTEFSNLLFAACLSPWRLLIVIDFCIRVFLSYALSPVILWLYWIPSTSFRTFHRLPRQVGTLWIQTFIG